uniref:Uncharacterized protein n=1 Tax=Anopheles atroparvus TaxID=41427 RepID=A0A182IM23_ANOAO
MQSTAPSGSPPIGARRVKTDLHTSENLYVHSVGRSRSNSPMHAGLLGRHGHRKAASEPKGIPGGPLSSGPPASMTFLTVPGGSTRPALPCSNRQRSSSTGTSAQKTLTAHQRVLPQTIADGGGGGGGSARLSQSPCRANDQLPSGAGVLNRSQLPARARLLTRRLQNNATPTNGSESPRSIDSLPRRTFAGAYKTATLSQFHNLANNNAGCTDSASTATNSAEDLTLLDKSLRNSMLQDVVHFKKQLVRLRRILQETDTLNPFENNNGQFFTTAAVVAAATVNNNSSAASGSIAAGVGPDGPGGLDSNKQQEQGAGAVLVRESGVAALALLEDQRQELADLRRQVVYLQNQQHREKQHREGSANGVTEATGAPATFEPPAGDKNHSETVSQATQTERRPVYVADFFPISPRSVGFEVALATRFAVHCQTAAISLVCLADRLLLIIRDLFKRLLTLLSPPVPSRTEPAIMVVPLAMKRPRGHLPGVVVGVAGTGSTVRLLGQGQCSSGSCPSVSAVSNLRNEQPTTAPKNGLRTPTAASSNSSSPSHSITNGTTSSGSRSTPNKTQISSVYTQLSSVRHSIAGSSAPTTPTCHGGPTALRRTSLGSSHNLSSFGLHGSPSPTSTSASKSVRTTHIGTLAATGRQPTNGERIPVLVNGAATKHAKHGLHANRTPSSAQTNGLQQHPSKANGLNGATKRPAATIIRPPSSFGASIAPIDAQQTLLKSKSAPATPLVANGKLLTAPATGNATDTSLNGDHTNGPVEPSGESKCENDSSSSSSSGGKETSADECESDTDTVVNGAAILGGLKLLPNGPVGCSDPSTSQIGANNTPNGIVGH